MKIREISFKNNAHPWELVNTKFSDLTLLVGVSGVGKTQILNNIMKLVNISTGHVCNGVEWDLHFIGDNEENYRWTGEFESIKGLRKQSFSEKDINGQQAARIPRLLTEKLYLENELVFERKESQVKYENKETPKISPYKSVLNLFTTEDKISPVKEAFEKIVFLDYQAEKKRITIRSLKELEIFYKVALEAKKKKNKKLDDLKKSPGRKESESLNQKIDKMLPAFFEEIAQIRSIILPKLFLAYYIKEVFEEIVEDFKDIFPQVEDVRFELLEDIDAYELQIKERGTGWISMSEISSGMFKTLLHLAEIKLMVDGYVILIDEFENSLGVNCIDTVAEDLLKPGRDLQYIITSHHPYIINNIEMKYWKVVMRDGTKVSTKNADELKLGKSKHQAFKQLLNLDEFTGGIS
jgi:ABC-type bacteriocin/lantibiotic exporter with double-glycine peptidase domain